MHHQIHFNANIRRAAIILATAFLAVYGADYLDSDLFSDAPFQQSYKPVASSKSKNVATPAMGNAIQRTASIK